MNEDLDTALSMQRAGRVREAALVYQRILARDPANAPALHYLGLTQLQLGDLDRARGLLARARELEPSNANTLSDYGAVLVRLEHCQEALEPLTRALELDPGHPDALNNMGTALGRLERPAAALEHFERLVAVRPRSAAAWSQLADTCLTLHQTSAGIAGLRRAVALSPELKDERVALGEALEATGRYRQARYQYLTVLEADPRHLGALARLLALREGRPTPQHIAMAQELRASGRAGTQDRVRLHAALAHYFDATGEYDQAFANCQAAHELRAPQVSFDSAGFSLAVDRLIEAFTPALFESLPRPTVRSRRPIFIIGMPRSGTTLAEQILASHPQVAAGGELLAVMNIVARIDSGAGSGGCYPHRVRQLSSSALDQLAHEYLEQLASVSADAPRVTDKLPVNFMHLGLIVALFPQAAIIHCRRDVLDTCLSCYFATFADELQFASDLETLGKYFLDYQRLMRHWRDVLPISIYELDYERLVQDTEPTVRALLRHCDLEWDNACLRFYESERAVRTPSHWQVRQPIYSKSVGRWRHYQRHLEPLKRIIQSHEADDEETIE